MPARISPDDRAPTPRRTSRPDEATGPGATPGRQPVVGRRVVLGGAAAGVLGLGAAGCGPLGGDQSGGTPPGALAPVLAGTLALVSGYQATLVAQPGLADRLTPLLADHHAHVTALLTAMGRPTDPAPTATGSPALGPVAADPTAALAQLRGAEQTGQADASQACVEAPAGYAALLGSIAACRATHVEALV